MVDTNQKTIGEMTFTELFESYFSLAGEINNLCELQDKIRDELKARMKENEESEHAEGVYKATFSSVNSSKFDQRLFTQEHPELASRYMKESSYQRFRISCNSGRRG